MIFVLRIVQSASVIAASFSHLGGKARSKPRHSLTKTQVRLRVGQTKGDDQRRLLQRHAIVQKRKIKSRPAAGIKLRLEISGGGRLRQHRFRSLERKITAPSPQTANYKKTARLVDAPSCSNKHQQDYFNLVSISFAISRCSRTVLAVLSAKLFTFGSLPSFASFSNSARSFS